MHTKFLYLFLFVSFIFKAQPGVMNNPIYTGEYTVVDCFRDNNYKGIFKADTIKSNYLMSGTKIWRLINLENKENEIIFNSTSKCSKIGLFEIIKFGIFAKKLHVFSSDNFNETKNTLLSNNNIIKIISLNDSSIVSVYDGDGVEKIEKHFEKRYLNGTDIKSFIVKENWVINNYSGKLEKVVIGVAPVFFNKTIQENAPLFWLYYDEWKELLASFEAKNYYSNSEISFYDVFEKKLFVSKIIKNENIKDVFLKTLKRGNDFESESELIKERLINMEEDLFEK